jgi:hypothetical protein
MSFSIDFNKKRLLRKVALSLSMKWIATSCLEKEDKTHVLILFLLSIKSIAMKIVPPRIPTEARENGLSMSVL